MTNKTYAIEWLTFSIKNLDTAKLLYEVNHYEDVIGINTKRRKNNMKQQAFILRIAPSGIDKVPQALEDNQIFIGWALAENLLNTTLTWMPFREIISNIYYPNESNLRKAGSAAGNMWRFIHEMRKGDLIVIPYGSKFYIAEIDGETIYKFDKVDDDTAYRRNVKWRNNKDPIPRAFAQSALISRMKSYLTCTYATDLLPEILECLTQASSNKMPSFQTDLQTRLVHETLNELRNGRMDSFGFEKMIQKTLLRLGASDARIVPRNQDKGADIIATFQVAGAFQQTIAIQAKHWQPYPPVEKNVVEQLIRGIEAESTNLGMIITSGTISDDAIKTANAYYEEKGIKIELVDGEQFAKLIVENGIQAG